MLGGDKFLSFAYGVGWCCALVFAGNARGDQSAPGPVLNPLDGSARVYGAATCSSTGCHGGADDRSRQYIVWSQRDVHSRAFATLATARAARMAEALQLNDPAVEPRCIVCHAPLRTVAPEQLAADARVSEGVSCISCHGPADTWLRSHTRSDYSHAERVAAGMRDLRDLRGRANSCVACHQNIEPDLIIVGRHPTLLFELDGQAQVEPKHWREFAGFNGAQAWFVGQAVAWREMSWALLHGTTDVARDTPRWQALRWLLQRTGLDYDLPALRQLPAESTPAAMDNVIKLADQLAQRAAQTWRPEQTSAVLARLAATTDDFRPDGETNRVLACRAERLVIALHRLLAALPSERRPSGASAQLDKLFGLAQSQEDFAPTDFAHEVAAFARVLELPASQK